MLNFNEIKKLIPPQGKLSFTVSEGRKGKLIVLLQPMYPEIDNVPNQKKQDYEQARTPMILKGTPEELNQGFMKILKQTQVAEDDLQTAFTKKQEAIKKAIKSTPEKEKPGPTKADSGNKTHTPTEKTKEEAPSKESTLGLFG